MVVWKCGRTPRKFQNAILFDKVPGSASTLPQMHPGEVTDNIITSYAQIMPMSWINAANQQYFCNSDQFISRAICEIESC